MQALTVATQIICRMEFAHLDVWFLHLRAHGVRRVFLFIEPDMVRDSHIGQGIQRTWEKKPEASYHLDLDSAECVRRVREVVDRWNGPEMEIRMEGVKSSHSSLGVRQRHCARWLVRRMREGAVPLTEWMCFLDVDEWLVCRSGSLLEHLSTHYQEPSIWAVQMWQRLMGTRFHKGEAVSPLDIGEHYGIALHAPKVLFKPDKTLLRNVHYAKCAPGHVHIADPEVLLFHHFRGKPATLRTNLRKVPMDSLQVYRNVTREPKPTKNYDHVHALFGHAPLRNVSAAQSNEGSWPCGSTAPPSGEAARLLAHAKARAAWWERQKGLRRGDASEGPFDHLEQPPERRGPEPAQLPGGILRMDGAEVGLV